MFCTADLGLQSKAQSFECLSSKKKYGFQASLSYRRPHFGLLGDILTVAYGKNTSFAEYQMTFWLALPSWFCKFSIMRHSLGTNSPEIRNKYHDGERNFSAIIYDGTCIIFPEKQEFFYTQ